MVKVAARQVYLKALETFTGKSMADQRIPLRVIFSKTLPTELKKSTQRTGTPLSQVLKKYKITPEDPARKNKSTRRAHAGEGSLTWAKKIVLAHLAYHGYIDLQDCLDILPEYFQDITTDDTYLENGKFLHKGVMTSKVGRSGSISLLVRKRAGIYPSNNQRICLIYVRSP